MESIKGKELEIDIVTKAEGPSENIGIMVLTKLGDGLRLGQKKEEDENPRRIKEAEELIEKTLWDAACQQDNQAELRGYEEAKRILETMPKISPALEKDRNRVLAFCLMRIDNALVAASDTKESVARMKKALEVAETSKDAVTIVRCLLALGARVASAGFLVEAESYWNRTLGMAEGHAERDMQQIAGGLR